MKQEYKICPQCLKKFVPENRSDQIYCSLKCNSRANYKKHYEYYRNYWLNRSHLFRWKKERKCELCGESFIPNQPNQTNCSIKCRRKKWKKRHWDIVLEKQRKWFKKDRKKNPEKYRFYVKNRRHLIRESSGSTKTFNKKFTLEDWIEIKRKHNFRCAICGKRKRLTIDHKKPLSKHGEHCKRNIQPACHSCNSRKKDHIITFVKHR